VGKFIPERDFVNELPTEKRLREVFEEYTKNIWSFEIKDSKAAGVRARNNLLELAKLTKPRRKEILERKKTIVPFKWEVEDGS
jgi:RecB family exonuclease